MAEHKTSKDTQNIAETTPNKKRWYAYLNYEISTALQIKKKDKSTFNNFLLNVPRELTSSSVCGSEFHQFTDRLKNDDKR